MKIRPKSPEQIQAQVLEFKRNADLDHNLSMLIGRRLSESDGNMPPADVVSERTRPLNTRVETSDEPEPYNQIDDDPEKEALFRKQKRRVGWQTIRTVVTYPEYVSFLREGGAELREDLDFVSSMNKAYKTYAPVVDQLRHEIAELDSPRAHPQYLASGMNGDVYQIEYLGQHIAVKIPKNDEVEGGSRFSHDDAVAFARGNRIEGLQHMLAASPNDGVIISELLEGKTAQKLSRAELQGIPDEHIEKAIDMVMQMHEQGLNIDGKLGNFIYDEKTGWSILDYEREAPKSTKSLTPLAEKLGYLAKAISPVFDGLDADNRTVEKFFEHLEKADPEVMRQTVAFLSKYYPEYQKVLSSRHEHVGSIVA